MCIRDSPYSWGTAVNVQSMAFGNMGDDCGTGVAFTRNPATGEKKLFGELSLIHIWPMRPSWEACPSSGN